MDTKFDKRQISFFVKLSLTTLILGGVHFYLYYSFFADTLLHFPLWQIYMFNIIAVALLFTVINYRFSRGNKFVFNGFMLGTLVKMILAILFLLPMLLSDIENKKPDVINFFIPYFLFLAFEIYCLTVFLKNER
ncbi:hypothetical protein [Maribacter sp. 2304DJ31-5]|uniref:hypothetical protein n=1 Tax=Maribacter sp. 2304DJ31-5 TaxID=3386273 RepID=UPI0039BD4FB6